MQTKLYTIGYAHRTQEALLHALLKYHINCIIDVRTQPYSTFHMQFNKENLKHYLKISGISYIHMDKPFGIIKGDMSLMSKRGYLDFVKLANTPAFEEGIERVQKGIEKGYTIAFMCAEKDPINCHRSTLVGRAFQQRGYEVLHILEDDTLETHQHMEERMKAVYMPIKEQLDLFAVKEDEQTRLEEAYSWCDEAIFIVNAKRVLKEAYDFPKQI